MKSIVISQPMFFPWTGMFEQIRLCDVFVHYDDVQFSKGSFFNRVQIKTANGTSWLTVPLKEMSLGQSINESMIDHSSNWQRKHLEMLRQSYARAPFKREMLEIVEAVYGVGHKDLAQFSADSIETVCKYYGLDQGREFQWSSRLNIPGESTDRVLAIVKHFGGDTYVTGHGARRYFGHELAESMNISVEYIDYRKTPYPQLHGEFTPYVSILDLIANVGRDGSKYLHSTTLPWRTFLQNEQASAA
ncbi:MAG: WbqC family protein [Planctomycetaceae bacterium]